MYIEFNNLENSSKVWIYQASRNFTEVEVKEVEKEIRNFIDSWKSHGNDLISSFEIRYSRFLVISIQEGQHICGRSLDELAYFINELGRKFDMDLLDRMNVCFRQGEYISYKPLNEFIKIVGQGAVSSKTIVFNNLVNTIDEYKNCWEVPMEESWHKRYLKK